MTKEEIKPLDINGSVKSVKWIKNKIKLTLQEDK